MYNRLIVDDIRRMEREKAISQDYPLEELSEKIKKYTRETYTCASGAIISLLSGMGGAGYLVYSDYSGFGLLSAVSGASLTGLLWCKGKISAIKVDAFLLAKENLEKKVHN